MVIAEFRCVPVWERPLIIQQSSVLPSTSLIFILTKANHITQTPVIYHHDYKRPVNNLGNGPCDNPDDIMQQETNWAGRRAGERRKVSRPIHLYDNDKWTFSRDVESKWYVHLDNCSDVCARWHVRNDDTAFCFKFSFSNGTDGKNHCDTLMRKDRNKRISIIWP